MSQRVVLDTQGDRPDETGTTVLAPPTGRTVSTAETTPASLALDPVRALAESVQRPGGLMYRQPGTRTQRPFDAQYWACWVVAVAFPLLMAYLWLAR
jgi:hypothetical protein